MHASDLIELSAFVAAEGATLRRSSHRISPEAMGQYWTASKCRLDRWGRALRGFQLQQESGERVAKSTWSKLRSVCEEVLATEMLTRVWSCIALSFDMESGSQEARPLVSSVLAGHMDVTNRVLNLLSSSENIRLRPAAELNRLRRLTERWTDLILGRLGTAFDFATVAYDAERAADFAEDFLRTQQLMERLDAWALLRASLRATFAKRLKGETANGDLNGRIAAAILACFPAEVFDSVGVYHSLWQSRLSAMTSDTQGMVEELLAAEIRGESSGFPSHRFGS